MSGDIVRRLVAGTMSIDGMERTRHHFTCEQCCRHLTRLWQEGALAVPFVSMFYGTPSHYLWEAFLGQSAHNHQQGENWGTGNHRMMPLLFDHGSALQRWRECSGRSTREIWPNSSHKFLDDGTQSGTMDRVKCHS